MLINMKYLILAVILFAGVTSCTSTEKLTFTARPDPNEATSGTLGSLKATDGVPPYADYERPGQLDTVMQRH
jgi:hypothetical protein